MAPSHGPSAMIPEAAALVALSAPPLRKFLQRVYSSLVVEYGCAVYVKTIYVGFTIDGAMVAAIYPRSDCLEIALALPEDIEGAEFKDATHLTWPTMPVCIEVHTKDDLTLALAHASEAARRVSAGAHDVQRPNEHFMGRVKRGTSRA